MCWFSGDISKKAFKNSSEEKRDEDLIRAGNEVKADKEGWIQVE